MKKLYVPSFKIIIQLVFIIFFFTLDILNLVAQPVKLQFKHLTPNDGLSSSAVSRILQDHLGFMWICTRDGLNQFDGYNFKLFKNNPSDRFSISGDIISAIYEDRNNNLLIGSNGGLSLFNRDSEQFVNYIFEESSPFYGMNLKVNSIVEDSLGNLWLATSHALIYFDRINNKAIQYIHDPNNPESLSNNYVESVYIDSENRIWVTTKSGLNLFQPSTGKFKHITHGENIEDNYSDFSFLGITEDQNKNIWFSSENGLFCLKNTSIGDDLVLTRYDGGPDYRYIFSNRRLLSVFVDNENNLWIGAENGGLFLFDREKERFWHYKSDDYDPASLNNESIQCIYSDNKDNLWIGTFGGGINISPKNSDAIFHYKNLKGSEQSLSNNVVSSFLLDHEGQIWVGTDGGGLNQFNEATNQFTRYNIDNSNLSSNVILSLVEMDDHSIWMGTWGGGLMTLNRERNKFTTFTMQNSKIPSNNIHSIAKDNHNDLWFGSNDMGLIHYQIEKNKFTAYSQSNSNINSNYIFVLKYNNKGQLYIGSTTGLQIFSPEEDRFVSFAPDKNNPNSISHGAIYDILFENDTCVWIATQNGLNRFNPQTQVFKQYFIEDGLPSNVIKSLVIDNSGVLWVSTSLGICRFDYQHNHYDLYTHDDGLQSNEFNGKSALLLKNGDLLFGGVNGFNIISPEKIVENLKIPSVIITGLEILNKPVIPNKPGSPLTTDISETDEMTLTYDQNILTFYFAVMDFTKPEKNQYAYMLENFDKNWIYSGSKREATYTNLDPGTYVLRVKGSNNDNIWNEEGSSLKITILPPWYLTWYFKTIFAIAILSLIMAIFYNCTSIFQKQKKLLTITVEEKTKDLLNKNILLKQNSDQLKEINSQLIKRQKIIEQQSVELKLQAEELTVVAENLEETNNELTSINATKDKFFSIIAHDLRSPFNSFLGFTEIMAEELSSLTMDEIQNIAESMRDSASNLFRLLENLLQWARIQQGLFSYKLKMVELLPIVDESIRLMMESAKNKEIETTNDIPNDLVVYADSNVLQMVIRNLLSNAVKFTKKGGKISLSAKTNDNNYVEISIKDTGIGMSNVLVDNLFRIDVSTNRAGTEGEPSTGLGLILCKDFIENQGGKFWVESKEGLGSVFYFSLPLGPVYSDTDELN